MAAYQPYGLTPGRPAEAPKKPHLYIGNLSPRVTDFMLTEIFAVAGPVVHAKIIQDRNYQHGGYNYGFVEYADMRSAEQAMQTLNGRKIFDAEIRVNWAYQGNQNKEDTQHHFHVFVGDLSPEVNDDVLGKAFQAFGSMSEARVMWDMNSGKSRGYGFLSFRKKEDAEQAINTMNGEWLGSRSIRVNWANQKTQTGGVGGGSIGGRGGGSGGMGMSSFTPPPAVSSPMPSASATPYRPPATPQQHGAYGQQGYGGYGGYGQPAAAAGGAQAGTGYGQYGDYYSQYGYNQQQPSHQTQQQSDWAQYYQQGGTGWGGYYSQDGQSGQGHTQ